MSVYDLDLKGMRQTFRDFHKTLYGRTVFLLAYIIPAFLFLIGLVVLLTSIQFGCIIMLTRSAPWFGSFIPTFVLGNIYFYTEIRHFCAYKTHQAHKAHEARHDHKPHDAKKKN